MLSRIAGTDENKLPSESGNSRGEVPTSEVKNNAPNLPPEIGGPTAKGQPEPTRYGDWEKGGRCIDF